MPSDGWPAPDTDAPMHGIVLAVLLGAVVWLTLGAVWLLIVAS